MNFIALFFMLISAPSQVEVFAPGEVTHGWHENSLTFSPNQNEIFYVVTDKSFQHQTIVGQKKLLGRWGKPFVALFSGTYKDGGPFYDPKGNMLFFSSIRPGNLVETSFDIWITQKEDGVWSNPINPGPAVNSVFHEANPAVDSSGGLYFQSNRGGNWDIYYAPLIEGVYQDAQPVQGELNSSYAECDPFVSPDGSFMLFHSNREDSYGVMDIYISWKEGELWGPAKNLGPSVNTKESDFGPTVSPDGKSLFFSSFRGHQIEDLKGLNYSDLEKKLSDPQNGYATLYWIDFSIR